MRKLCISLATALAVSAPAYAEPACTAKLTNNAPAHSAEVKQIITELAGLTTTDLDSSTIVTGQQRLFAQLERLGPEAVPAIIEQMDDRRSLAVPQISLENRYPGAFEGVRHYGPKLIVDALDAILPQITGYSGLVPIVNGGSELERQLAVHGWRTYAANPGCSRAEGN